MRHCWPDYQCCCAQAEFAPYKDHRYAWNPAGTGFADAAFDIPIMLLDDKAVVAESLRRADGNAAQVFLCWATHPGWSILAELLARGSHSDAYSACL